MWIVWIITNTQYNSNGITSHNIFFTPIIPSFYLEKCVLFLNFWNLPLIYVKRTFSIYLCLKEKEKSVWNIYEMAFSLRQESSVFQKDRLLVKSFLYFVRPCILSTVQHIWSFFSVQHEKSSLFSILKMKLILVNSQINFR